MLRSGVRPIDNPPSRFAPYYLEWEIEPPAASLQVFEDSSKSILVRNESPDVPFRWSVNPYRGCTHACAYCYARPSHEYLGFGAGTDFDSKIVVKSRAPELLRAELYDPRWQGELIAFSGDTDCYQPLEAHYRLTRGCLEVCRDVGNPVGIVTKSFLITRDVALLAELAREDLVSVAMSIAFLDDDMARAIEPGAPRPTKRFEAMRILTEAGVPVEILIGPIIPGLNEDQIPKLLTRAKDCGASGASRVVLRLPGAVKDVFLSRLRQVLPLRADRVEARIRDVRGGNLSDPRFGHRMTGSGTYFDAIDQSFVLHRKRLGLTRAWRGEHKAANLRRPGQLGLFSHDRGGAG